MRIRPATAADHDAFIATAARAGLKPPSIRFYLNHSQISPYVAEEAGVIIGTGAAVRHGGKTGWLAVIAVDPDWQGRGIGRALVEQGEQILAEQGAQSVHLLATEAGKPVYAKMGFVPGPGYRIYEGVGLPALPASSGVRPLAEGDWPAVLELDQGATGEDRSWALREMRPGYAVLDGDGRLRGCYHPAPWGGGPAVALDSDAGRMLIDLARTAHGPNPLILRVPEVNQAGVEYLEQCGFTLKSRNTYMVKGAWPAPYRPERIWGMFSFALG